MGPASMSLYLQNKVLAFGSLSDRVSQNIDLVSQEGKESFQARFKDRNLKEPVPSWNNKKREEARLGWHSWKTVMNVKRCFSAFKKKKKLKALLKIQQKRGDA